MKMGLSPSRQPLVAVELSVLVVLSVCLRRRQAMACLQIRSYGASSHLWAGLKPESRGHALVVDWASGTTFAKCRQAGPPIFTVGVSGQ